MECGKRIREIRKAQGKTQTYLAGKLGKTPAWLNNIEHGRRKITLEDAAKLAEALGVPVKEFFLATDLNDAFNELATGTTG